MCFFANLGDEGYPCAYPPQLRPARLSRPPIERGHGPHDVQSSRTPSVEPATSAR